MKIFKEKNLIFLIKKTAKYLCNSLKISNFVDAKQLKPNIMKAIEILKNICEEGLNLECCNVVHGETIIDCNVSDYFGMPLHEGSIESDKTYFWIACNYDCAPNCLDIPNAIVGDDDNTCWYFLYVIEE